MEKTIGFARLKKLTPEGLVVEVNEKPMPTEPIQWLKDEHANLPRSELIKIAIERWSKNTRTIPVAKEEEERFFMLAKQIFFNQIKSGYLSDALKEGIILPADCIVIRKDPCDCDNVLDCPKKVCEFGKEFAYLKKEEESQYVRALALKHFPKEFERNAYAWHIWKRAFDTASYVLNTTIHSKGKQ